MDKAGWLGVCGVMAAVVAVSAAQAPPAYKDASRPVDVRVADLLGRMTIEEKVAQLQGIWVNKKDIQDAEGRFVPANAQKVLGLGIGQVSRPSEIGGTPQGPRGRDAREHAQFVNDVQKWVLEHTRLGIPVMFHEEACTGSRRPAATHFPVPIGLASTWDPALVERVMSVAAREARSRGCQEVLRRSWISAAIHGGDGSKKPTARIRISCRGSASPPSAVIRAPAFRSRKTRSSRR